MKLIDLDPHWFTITGSDDVVGITFLCPHCRVQRLGVEFDTGIDKQHRHPDIVWPVPPDGRNFTTTLPARCDGLPPGEAAEVRG
jgi:hypothetical protein